MKGWDSQSRNKARASRGRTSNAQWISTLKFIFGDDKVIAGRSSEVLRALRHMTQVMLFANLRFFILRVVAVSGERHAEDRFADFRI